MGAVLCALASLLPLGPRPTGLAPDTVVQHLLNALPEGAHDVRINHLYGSSRAGLWQFIAHLSWRDERSTLEGGILELPQDAGSHPAPTHVDLARLALEHQHGWPAARLTTALQHGSSPRDRLALVALEIPINGSSTLTVCQSVRTRTAGRAEAKCTQHDSALQRRRFTDTLTVTTDLRPLSVHRAGAAA